jgi:hypothetical protein
MAHTTRMRLHTGRMLSIRKRSPKIPLSISRSPPIYFASNLGFLELRFGHHLHPFHLFHSISTKPSHWPISKAVQDICSPESREEVEERRRRLAHGSIQSLIISFCCILYCLDILCEISFVLALCIFIVFFICCNERLSTLVFRDLECETLNMSIY